MNLGDDGIGLTTLRNFTARVVVRSGPIFEVKTGDGWTAPFGFWCIPGVTVRRVLI